MASIEGLLRLFGATETADRLNPEAAYLNEQRKAELEERRAFRNFAIGNKNFLGQLESMVPNAASYIDAGGNLEGLGKLRQITLGTDRPAAIQEEQYYQGLPKDRRDVFSGLQGRSSIVDLNDRYVITDKVTGEQREIMKAGQGTAPAAPRTAPVLPPEPMVEIQGNQDFIDMPLPPTQGDMNFDFSQFPELQPVEVPQFESAGIKGIAPEQAPAFKAEQAAAVEAAKASAKKGGRDSKIDALFGPLDLLAESAKNAPSGLISGLSASVQNYAGGSGPESLAQGDFTVKQASAESAIREAFRIAGSGADTDRDAKPFIMMLPNEYDSAGVKAAKIKAAKEAVQTRLGQMAKEKGVKNPFGEGAAKPEQAGGNFTNEEEAEAANLPSGTIITINGRKARVQ